MIENLSSQAMLRSAAMLALALLSQGMAWPQAALEVEQTPGTELIRFSTAKAGRHTLEIDDAAGFVTPVAARVFNGRKLELRAGDAGLIPGLAYHLRLDGEPQAKDLRLSQAVVLDARADCASLRHTWEASTRFSIGRGLSGLQWVGDHWLIVPHRYLLGESLYNAELLLRPALEGARACGDMQTLDEMAQYYTIMLRQTETVGELLKRPGITGETLDRLRSTDPAARTFSASFGTQVGEGELYNSQWLHPAALLVRVVTELPEARRTPAMKSFAGQYTQFIVKDQLDRFLFRQHQPSLGGIPVAGRVARWEQAMRGLKGNDSWDTAMSDIDLWLLASAAEILGAHANDPQLAPIDPQSLAQLRAAVATGVRFFQSKRTLYPETRNFNGQTVGSASYFNGDYATHSDNAFSAVGGEKLPTAAQQGVKPDVSWDTSHAYRLPIFLRALYENRKATGAGFPALRDVQLVVNQYVYKVFTGDFARPLFRNFFDGSDGWFRVGFVGNGFGYPPSDFCDMHNPARPCLIPGAIVGWGQVAFANADLARLESALVSLAFEKDAGIAEFRDRHYFWNSSYGMSGVRGSEVYSGAFYLVVAENAGMIPAANQQLP